MARRFGLVVAGGLLGATLRHLLAGDSGDLAWGVLAVNLLGATLAGFLVGRTRRHAHAARWLLPVAVIGVAGAMTTFSGVVVDVLLLMQAARWIDAGVFSSAVIVTGPVAAAIGLWAGERP